MGVPSDASKTTTCWRTKTALLCTVCMGLGTVLYSGTEEAIGGEPPLPAVREGPSATADGMDPVTKFLLDDALAQGRISKQRHQALTRDFEEQAYLRQPVFKLWYDRGLNLGMNNNSFLLKIRGRLTV